MTPSRAPLAVARAGLGLAVRVLPTRSARERYRAELLAELHDLDFVTQLWFTAGVLSQTLTLRAALVRTAGRSHSWEEAMAVTRTGAPFWRCRVFRWHDWVRRSTEDGGRYHTCARCGADRGPGGYGPMTTPPWPGWR